MSGGASRPIDRPPNNHQQQADPEYKGVGAPPSRAPPTTVFQAKCKHSRHVREHSRTCRESIVYQVP